MLRIRLDSLPEEAEAVFYLERDRLTRFLRDVIRLDECWFEEITGAVVLSGDDEDPIAVWLSESSRPWNNCAAYYPLPYYAIDKVPPMRCWGENNRYYKED